MVAKRLKLAEKFKAMIRRFDTEAWRIDEEFVSHIPSSVFHYTSVDGLAGILGHKCLWASRALYLNDESEFLYGLERCGRQLHRIGRETKGSLAIANVLAEQLKAAEMAPFVVCFCTAGDLLSQWRGYSRVGAGVSIEFVSKKLADIDRFFLFRVLYNEKLQDDYLHRYATAITNQFTSSGVDLTDPEVLEEIATYSGMLESCCVLMKYPSFEEEDEIRLSATDYYFKPHEIKFRQRGNFIVPYVHVDLTPCWRGLIRSVIVGPGPDREARKRNVQEILRLANLSNVKVTLSKSQFRP